jgi:hypothetical protein
MGLYWDHVSKANKVYSRIIFSCFIILPVIPDIKFKILKSYSFNSVIHKIGINPYVAVPDSIMEELFADAGKNTGAIPVKGLLNGKKFIHNLVKYSGLWRLYLNTPMRRSAGIDTGDIALVTLSIDKKKRTTPMPDDLKDALAKNKKAADAFHHLPPSFQKEIMRYINGLKSEESRERNVRKAIAHLLGKEKFIGRLPLNR